MLKEEEVGALAPGTIVLKDPPVITEPEEPKSTAGKKAPPTLAGLYRAAWRWHFYSGMFVIPVLLVLAVTGMIYLFQPQVDPMLYKDRMRVQLPAEGATQIPLDQQVAAVEAAYPGYKVVSVKTPTYPGRSTEVSINNVARGEEGLDEWWGVHLWVYVDPSTGRVLADIDPKDTFMADVRELHGNLMTGQKGFGDTIVEIVASWGVVLVATGFYLWFRGRKPRNALRESGRLQGRNLTRNRHALTGSLAGFFLVFLIVSGLPWSHFWGGKISEIQAATATGAPEFREEATVSDMTIGDLGGGQLDVPWATEEFPVPVSEPAGGHHSGAAGSGDNAPATSKPKPIGLDKVAQIVEKDGPAKNGFVIGVPEGETGVYTASLTQPNSPHGNRTMNIDQYSGKVLADYGFGDYGLLGQAVSDGIALHEGRRFGAGNLWFNFAICAMVIFLCITGPMMWWKRRPSKAVIAAPRRSKDPRTRRRLFWLVMVPIGILFPLGGITMLGVIVLDWLVLRRIPRLAKAFGSV